MQINSQNQISDKKKFIRSALVIITVLLLIGLVLLYLTLKPKSDLSFKEVVPSPIPKKEAVRQPTDDVYLINQINSQTGVIGYSWHNEIIIYATGDGIYNAENNEELLSAKFSYIKFNKKGFAINKIGTAWYLFDPGSLKNTPVELSGDNPSLNEDGTFVISNEKDKLFVKNLKTNQASEVETGEIIKTVWAYQKNIIVTEEETLSTKKVVFYDLELNKLNEVEIAKTSTFLDVSPDSSKIALINDNNLIIKTITEDEEIYSEFTKNASFTGNWISSHEFVLIETSLPNEIGRVTDFIWKVDPSGDKLFLTNSNPIPRKLNKDVYLSTNSYKEIIPLVENNGKIWILALIPNVEPNYAKGGTYFIPIPEVHKDH